MNCRRDQTPTHHPVVAPPSRMMIGANGGWRERITLSRNSLKSARFAPVNSGCGRNCTGRVDLVKRLRVVLTEILPVFVVRHLISASVFGVSRLIAQGKVWLNHQLTDVIHGNNPLSEPLLANGHRESQVSGSGYQKTPEICYVPHPIMSAKSEVDLCSKQLLVV